MRGGEGGWISDNATLGQRGEVTAARCAHARVSRVRNRCTQANISPIPNCDIPYGRCAADVAAGRGTATAVTICRSVARPQGLLITPIPRGPHHTFRMSAKPQHPVPNTRVPPPHGVTGAEGCYGYDRGGKVEEHCPREGEWSLGPVCQSPMLTLRLLQSRHRSCPGKERGNIGGRVSEATSVASTLWMQHGLCQVTSH